MKVYELIEKLMRIPAGCEVDFYDGAGTVYEVKRATRHPIAPRARS